MSNKNDLDGYDAKTRRMMKGMAEAENQALAARAEEECECKDGMFPSMDRGEAFLLRPVQSGPSVRRPWRPVARLRHHRALWIIPSKKTRPRNRAA